MSIFEELIGREFGEVEHAENGFVITYTQSRFLPPTVMFHYRAEYIAKVVVNVDTMYISLSETMPEAEMRIERDIGHKFEAHEMFLTGLETQRIIKIFEVVKHHIIHAH